jgi:EmrB/QacA subfamily drug resistance transporter
VRHVLLLILCAAQLLLIVDVVVVNVALPAIKLGLGVPDGQLQLASVAYTVTFGSLLIVAGRLGDAYGRRRLFLAGLAVFTVASVLTGAAQTEWQLFASRALQGVGAAMLAPTTLALVTSTFAEGEARNRALGVWAAVGSGGAIAGQLLGGVVADLLGWRWIFFLNAPLGVLALLVGWRLLPESRAANRPRLDLGGALTLALGLASLSLALSQLAEHGFGLGSAGAAIVAAGLLGAFIGIERRHLAPLLPFEVVRRPSVWAGNVVLALLAGSVAAALFFTTLYMQLVLGYSPLQVGAAFAPVTLIVLIVSPFASRLVGRLGARSLMLVGGGLSGLGLLLLAGIDTDGSYIVHVLPGLALIALGNGVAFAPTMIAGTHGVAEHEHGLASGLLNTSQELGSALGLGVLASVATLVARGSASGTADDILVDGYRAGYICAAALIVLAVLAASRLPSGVGRSSGAAAAKPALTTGG